MPASDRVNIVLKVLRDLFAWNVANNEIVSHLMASHTIVIRWQFLTLLLRDGMWCRKLNEIQYIDELKNIISVPNSGQSVARYFCISSQHQKKEKKTCASHQFQTIFAKQPSMFTVFDYMRPMLRTAFIWNILHFMLVLFTVYTFLLQWPVRRIRLEMPPLCPCIVTT